MDHDCRTCARIARTLASRLRDDGTPRTQPNRHNGPAGWTDTARALHDALDDTAPGGDGPDTAAIAVLAGPHISRIAASRQLAPGRLPGIVHLAADAHAAIGTSGGRSGACSAASAHAPGIAA